MKPGKILLCFSCFDMTEFQLHGQSTYHPQKVMQGYGNVLNDCMQPDGTVHVDCDLCGEHVIYVHHMTADGGYWNEERPEKEEPDTVVN